jgi:hypothetical protein
VSSTRLGVSSTHKGVSNTRSGVSNTRSGVSNTRSGVPLWRGERLNGGTDMSGPPEVAGDLEHNTTVKVRIWPFQRVLKRVICTGTRSSRETPQKLAALS